MSCIKAMSKNIDDLVYCTKIQDATLRALHERIAKLEVKEVTHEESRPENHN